LQGEGEVAADVQVAEAVRAVGGVRIRVRRCVVRDGWDYGRLGDGDGLGGRSLLLSILAAPPAGAKAGGLLLVRQTAVTVAGVLCYCDSLSGTLGSRGRGLDDLRLFPASMPRVSSESKVSMLRGDSSAGAFPFDRRGANALAAGPLEGPERRGPAGFGASRVRAIWIWGLPPLDNLAMSLYPIRLQDGLYLDPPHPDVP
jgi:hypothetical protein